MSIQKRQWGENTKPRYVARVRVGGSQRSKSFGTLRAAQDWERSQYGRKPTGRRTDNKLMSSAVKVWSEQATESAVANRKHLVENLGDLADMRVGDVTTDDVRTWRKVLGEGRPWAEGKAFKPSTISTLTRVLSAFFNEQVAKEQISRNPVLGARKGSMVAEKTAEVVDPSKLLTVDQVRAIIDQADKPVDVIVELMATSGIRPGEMSGLKVSSVDLDGATVHVVNQASGVYGDWAWKPLKSVKSRRSIPLPTSTVAALRSYLSAHPDYVPESPLFRTERGYQWTPAHFGTKFKSAAKKATVTGHSPKSLRHFYASKLIRAGESVAVVQARLGHASPMVTLGTYTHLWEDAADTTRAAVDGLF